jgi:hypothetical protein
MVFLEARSILQQRYYLAALRDRPPPWHFHMPARCRAFYHIVQHRIPSPTQYLPSDTALGDDNAVDASALCSPLHLNTACKCKVRGYCRAPRSFLMRNRWSRSSQRMYATQLTCMSSRNSEPGSGLTSPWEQLSRTETSPHSSRSTCCIECNFSHTPGKKN